MTMVPPSQPSELGRAVDRLRAGGLVAFPTETVYGLGADAQNEAAIARVYLAKGRPAANPLIVHVADAGAARTCLRQWTDAAQALAETFWPGPLSIILPRAESIPPIATAGGPNVAVRCPDHPLTLALLRAFGGPLVGPSANRSGHVSPTTPAHVREEFPGDDVMVLDGGPCRAGIESTVVDLTVEPALIRRPGVVGLEELAAVIPGVAHAPALARGESAGGVMDDGGPLPSPGLLERHYAPRSRAILFQPEDFVSLTSRHAPGGVIVLTHVERVATPGDRIEIVLMPSSARAYAAALYATLRAVDAHRPGLIAIEHPPRGAVDPAERALWDAITDRLRRATA